MLTVSFEPMPEKYGRYKLNLKHVYRLASISCETCGWRTRAVKVPKKGWGHSYLNPSTYLSMLRSAERHRCPKR